MTNVTLAIDEDIVKKVRKIALEKNTSLTALIRDMLEQLAAREDLRMEQQLAELEQLFDSNEVDVGRRTWTREDLHVR